MANTTGNGGIGALNKFLSEVVGKPLAVGDLREMLRHNPDLRHALRTAAAGMVPASDLAQHRAAR